MPLTTTIPWTLTRIRFARIVGAIVALTACSGEELPPIAAESEYVRIRHDEGSEICAGTIHHLDAIAGEFYRRFGEEPGRDAVIDYVWTHPDGVGEHCSMGVACATDDREHDRSFVFSDDLPNLHEMVHAARYRVWPQPSSVLEEGLAEAWGDQTPDQRWPDGLLLADLFPNPMGREEYEGAHHVVYDTIETFGWDAFNELWVGSRPGMGLDEFTATYSAKLEASLDAVLLERNDFFACVRPVCAGETIAPVAEVLRMDLPRACTDETTIGPDLSGSEPRFRRVYILEGHDPGWYTLQVPTEPNEIAMVFESCDTICYGDLDELTTDGFTPDEVYLDERPYQVTLVTEMPFAESVTLSPRN